MTIHARYVHTNLVAEDWKRLAAFYEDVFGCTIIPPERNLQGEWLEAGTGVPGAHVRGAHLRLPGYGEDGPTLEIFQYNALLDRAGPAANRPGFSHIAFAVDDVHAVRAAVLAAGGRSLGQVVSVPVTGVGIVTFAYLTDPEGNIIEVQSWSD